MLRVWKKEGIRALLRRVRRKILAVSYEAWTAKNQLTAAQLAQQRRIAGTLAHRPLISIVTPTCDTAPQFLHDTIKSVVGQTYDHWELCLVGGCPEGTVVRELLETLTRKDKRIHIKFDERALRASRSNEALAMARGEFIALLDPGDTLEANALFEVVELLNKQSSIDLIYFDEDKISENSRSRYAPFFKPDWSPELLLSVNYLAHCVIRRKLVEEVGGFTRGIDGAEEWDVLLRCTEHTRAIAHVPKVLYHRRQARGSNEGLSGNPRALEDQLRCVETHLRHVGIVEPEVVFSPPGVVRVTWPTSGSKVSIIIPNKGQARMLERCIASIMQRTSYRNFDLLVIDNGSTDDAVLRYYASLASVPQMRIINHPGAFNFSKANNLGARLSSGDILLFLNNDTEALAPDWLEEMVRWAERPEIGTVGAKLLYPDGCIQHAGIIIGMGGLADHVYREAGETHRGILGSVNWYRNYMAVTGACMMMRREVFEEVGGFDEAYQLVYSDVEICLRIIRKGYRIIYTPFARLRHWEATTRRRSNPPHDVRRACEQMRDLVEAGDPYFNPNLSCTSLIPMLPLRFDRGRFEKFRRLAKRASA